MGNSDIVKNLRARCPNGITAEMRTVAVKIGSENVQAPNYPKGAVDYANKYHLTPPEKALAFWLGANTLKNRHDFTAIKRAADRLKIPSKVALMAELRK